MKRLILCFDGTWNTADNGGSPTNIVRLARMIPPQDAHGIKQVVFYDEGVGTGNAIDRIAGGAFGNGLENHVKAGFRFLAQNYEIDDEIFIFGFSRGAFSARSLGGFIGACRGLLKRDKTHLTEKAWNFYRTPPGERSSHDLRNDILPNVQESVRIKVMGVFDTVGSLGIPTNLVNTYNRSKYSFHDTELSKLVDCALQALAIDEKRAAFSPTLWVRPKEGRNDQFVEQVWFSGVHSDIGGGYSNSELSDLSLRWMLARTLAHSKLEIDRDKLEYLLPELAFPENAAARENAIDRMRKKWRAELHDSLGAYAVSKAYPRMRVIGGQKPRKGTGLINTFFRTSEGSGFMEKIHWSAAERFRHWKAEELDKYEPPNLRVAIDDLDIVNMEDECKPGTFWS